jgi:hypothetical protein
LSVEQEIACAGENRDWPRYHAGITISTTLFASFVTKRTISFITTPISPTRGAIRNLKMERNLYEINCQYSELIRT